MSGFGGVFLKLAEEEEEEKPMEMIPPVSN